jgi:hypothetical protein
MNDMIIGITLAIIILLIRKLVVQYGISKKEIELEKMAQEDMKEAMRHYD